MKIIAIILIIIGLIGIFLGSMMYGDIGLAAIIGASASLVSGIGFLKINKSIQELNK